MKKYIIVLLALVFVLCAGCSNQDPVQTDAPSAAPTTPAVPTAPTVPPTTAATEPQPELSMGSALVEETPAVLDTLMRDDVVDVVGEYDEDHYVIKTDIGYGLVKKTLLRMEGEEAYQAWTGYAYYNAEVYDNLYLTGEPNQKLKQNTKVEVLEDLGFCYVIRLDGTLAFMNKTRLAKWPISSGGGSADGGDISLQFQGGMVALAAIEQTGDVTGQAVVLADGAEIVLGYFNRGEEIPMVAAEGFAENRDGYITVYLGGMYAYVPQMLVKTEDMPAYEAWDGYSRWNSTVYENFYLLGDPVISKLNANVKVHVIVELETCYLVEVNGTTGYMAKDMVSQTKYSTGGGSSSGGAEWSPPAL